MTTMATPGTEVDFEGFGVGSELWGATQANFIVTIPGRPSKEAAVMLNSPAAKYLAEALGIEDSDESRRTLARAAGEAALKHALGRGDAVASVTTVSRALLESHPGLLEAVRASLG